MAEDSKNTIGVYVPSQQEKDLLPDVLKESGQKIDDYFWPGWDGYPIEEAKADFHAFTGTDLPTNPTAIGAILNKVLSGELPGEQGAIKAFVQSQPTINHLNGVFDIVNEMIGKAIRAIDRAKQQNAREGEIRQLNDELEQSHKILDAIMQTKVRLMRLLEQK